MERRRKKKQKCLYFYFFRQTNKIKPYTTQKPQDRK